MSFSDVVDRIQQIESQIVSLNDPVPATDSTGATATSGTTGTTGTSSTSGASFASTLDAASGQMVTPSAGQMVDNGVTGADVVADAQKYIGVPYVFGGTTSAGLDCSGLVQRVYEDLGIQLPRLVSGQGTIGETVPSLADAQPGDLIVCDGGNHIAIYAGNGMIIQAPKPGGQVEEMPNWITQSNVVTIQRIVPTQSDTTASTSGTSSVNELAGLLGGSTDGTSALTSLLGSSGGTSALSSLLGASSGSGALASLLGSSGGTSALDGLLGSSGSSDSTGSAGTLAAIIGESIEASALSSILGGSDSGTSSLLGSGGDLSSILGGSSSDGITGTSGSSDSLSTDSLLFSLMSGGLT
jgi:cell wall-associated NlpC family hydrolase